MKILFIAVFMTPTHHIEPTIFKEGFPDLDSIRNYSMFQRHTDGLDPKFRSDIWVNLNYENLQKVNMSTMQDNAKIERKQLFPRDFFAHIQQAFPAGNMK